MIQVLYLNVGINDTSIILKCLYQHLSIILVSFIHLSIILVSLYQHLSIILVSFIPTFMYYKCYKYYT
jgi:hypothetical protein